MFPGGECAAVPGRDMAAPQAAGWSPRPSSGCNANQAFYFLLIRESQPAIRAWLRDGPCAGGTVREARDHGPEMVAAIAAPGEAGGMAFGVVEAGLPVGSNDRALMFPSKVLTRLKGAMRAALRLEPVRIARWLRPAQPRAVRQAKASVATLASGGGRAARRFGPRAVPRLRKPPTGTGLALRGRPSGRGHERRPAGCAPSPPTPEHTPPGWASSIPTRPDRGFSRSR